jgi:hypothetical protein
VKAPAGSCWKAICSRKHSWGFKFADGYLSFK